MTGDRSLTPADATVAVRSFPRRFRAVFARPDDEDEHLDPDEVARRPDADGTSAAEHLLAATALVEALPDLGDADVDDDGTAVREILDRLERAAGAAASRIEGVPNDRWAGRLEAIQDGVAAVASHLRAAQRAMTEVR